jgi:hypothetical protein
MRTTLTLDPDVAALLKEALRARETSLKQVVNEALREALPRLGKPAPGRRPYRIRPVSLGRCLVGSLDDVADVLAVAEGERFR